MDVIVKRSKDIAALLGFWVERYILHAMDGINDDCNQVNREEKSKGRNRFKAW